MFFSALFTIAKINDVVWMKVDAIGRHHVEWSKQASDSKAACFLLHMVDRFKR
jgi:hypothetical protein